MSNFEEKILELENYYKNSLDTQEKYYESELKFLKAKFEYEKSKLIIEAENQLSETKKSLKETFDAKNAQDKEIIENYYKQELKSQALWYEEEIIKRQKQTEDWHLNNLQKQLDALKQSYEEMLSAQKDKFDVEINVLYEQIQEQKKYYEAQLKPFKKFLNLKTKINKKINKYFKLTNNNKKNTDFIQQNNMNYIQEQTENPKVSVILPIYNVDKYLRQSLDSLINQTLKEIEIICVNDGSTDNCYEILEEYKQKDNRIKVIHKENKGTGAARNDGLRIATGECIGFVDPDDWVKPNMFERLYALIKEKNLDIAMCMPDGFDEKNNENKPFPYFVDENFENIIHDRVFNWKDLSPFSYPMCVWNKLYTKKLFDENNIEFAEGLDFEDHKVIFGSLLTAKRIFFIREKLYVYRFNREGSVLTDNNRRLIDHIKIFDIVENLMKETNTFEPLRTDFLFYKIHNIFYYYSMIKEEFKQEYYEKMVNSIKAMNLTENEYSLLSKKYPELLKIEIK